VIGGAGDGYRDAGSDSGGRNSDPGTDFVGDSGPITSTIYDEEGDGGSFGAQASRQCRHLKSCPVGSENVGLSGEDMVDQAGSDDNTGSDSSLGRLSADESAGSGTALREEYCLFDLFRFRALILNLHSEGEEGSGPESGPDSDAGSESSSASEVKNSRVFCP
jgi:hypothetical protein